MATSPFNPWTQANKFDLEPLTELNGITSMLYGEMIRQNMKTVNEYMQCYAEHLQGLSHAKGIDDVMILQSRWVSKTSSQLFQHSQKMLDILLASSTEYSNWFKKSSQQIATESKAMQEKIMPIKKRN